MNTSSQAVLPTEILKKTERVFSLALLAIALVVLIAQLRSLFYSPVFDSYLWWGDESWLMIEFKEQILHGVLRNPLALGSTLHIGSGLLLGNMWVTALLYGLPQHAASASADPVSVGRIVTALVSVGLISSSYYLLRTWGVSLLLAAITVLLIVTSRAFYLTSHSARYDIISALAILWILYWVSARVEKQIRPMILIRPKGLVLLGAAVPATLLVTHHVLLLSSFLLLFAAIRLGAFSNVRSIGFMMSGFLMMAVLLLGCYWLANGSVSLLQSDGAHGFFLNVREIPILRPFSRSVQIANLVQHWKQSTFFAPLIIAYAVIVFTIWLTQLLRRRAGSSRIVRLSPLTIGALIVLASWVMLESAAPSSYVIYIVPVLALASARSLQRLLDTVRASTGLALTGQFLVFILGAAIAANGYQDAALAGEIGLRISGANVDALNEIHAALQKDARSAAVSKPLALVMNPALDRFTRFGDVRVMTTHFVEYPESQISPDSVLRQYRCGYIVAYASPLNPDYMREVAPVTQIASARGIVLTRVTGVFTDIGRSYFREAPLEYPDTLTLYRLHE